MGTRGSGREEHNYRVGPRPPCYTPPHPPYILPGNPVHSVTTLPGIPVAFLTIQKTF